MIRERAKRSVVWTMNDEKFENLVKTSKSIGDICMKIGVRKAGALFTNVQTRITTMGLKTEHFIDGRVGKFSPLHVSKTEFLWRIKNKEHMDWGWMKKKIIEFSLIPYKCCECRLTNEWNGKPLVLHLDHKNGDFTNNEMTNLQFLCPNCHTQTETYSRMKRCIGNGGQ